MIFEMEMRRGWEYINEWIVSEMEKYFASEEWEAASFADMALDLGELFVEFKSDNRWVPNVVAL